MTGCVSLASRARFLHRRDIIVIRIFFGIFCNLDPYFCLSASSYSTEVGSNGVVRIVILTLSKLDQYIISLSYKMFP